MQYILDRAKFYLKSPPSSGVGYKKIFSYMTQKTPFGPEKKTTWSEIQISALTSIYDVLLWNQPVPQKKKSFLQESFFDNMPAYTLYDIPYLDTEDQRTDAWFALIKNILFEWLQKINSAYVEILAWKRILTKEGEAMLGIMGGWCIRFYEI